MSKPKILITGSGGNLGGILKKGLKNKFEVYGLDIVDSSESNFFKADISDMDQLGQVFNKLENLYGIIHLAAAHGEESKWQDVLKNNIIGLRNIFECALKFKVKRTVFISSNHATKGWEKDIPQLDKQKKLVTVMDAIRPMSDYGASKAFGEIMARKYYE